MRLFFLGIEWEKEIKDFFCILVSFYANDIEFGEIYRFKGFEISDFHQTIIK